jgi:anti-sigma-K factor RskA
MSVHEQFAEDLALYALGVLEGDGQIALEKHLESCADCRHELEYLRGDTALLSLTTSGPRPPARARAKLLAAIASETRQRSVATRKTSWVPIPWFATAILALTVVFLWRDNSVLHDRIHALHKKYTLQQADLDRARDLLATLTAPDSMHVTLLPTKATPQPQGKAMYERSRGSLIFMASNCPAVPNHMAYELWLIPMKGAPIPAGMFKPDPHGGAMVINPPLPMGVEAKAFAVTLEPEAGSPTPTMPIVMMGEGS